MFTTTKDAPKFMGFKGRTAEGVSSGGTDVPVPSFSWQPDANSKPQRTMPPRGKPKRTAAQLRDGITRRRIHTRSLMTALMALPLDLIYEIFAHLHPLDLLKVARTSKLLRSYLMSKASASVWKTSREAVLPAVPECPPDQSEPQWAYFIFNLDCTLPACGTTRAQCIIWELHLRCCNRCVEKQTVDLNGAKERFPNIGDLQTVLDALPYAIPYNIGADQVKHYHVPAIKNMGGVVEEYQRQIAAGTATAKKEFDEFIEARKSLVEGILKHTKLCEAWSENVSIDAYSPLNRRRREILERLKGLGHDECDIELIPSMQDIDEKELTHDEWIEMRPMCIDATVENRKERMRIEKKELFAARRAVAEKLFKEYKKTNNIPKYSLFPTTENVMAAEIFREVYEREEGGLATDGDFVLAMKALPALCETQIFAKKRKLLSILVAGKNADAENDQKAIDNNNFNCFKLITSAFDCHQSNSLVYADSMLGAHTCSFSPKGDSVITHWNFGCLHHEAITPRAISDVIRAVGLGPDEVTPNQMDNLNARFYCQSCFESYPLARSWRNAVAHALHEHEKELPGWTVLSVTDRDRIVEQENRNQQDPVRRFLCKHCDLPPRNFNEITKHILNTHGYASVNDCDMVPSIPPTPLSLLAPPRSESPDTTNYSVGFLFE